MEFIMTLATHVGALLAGAALVHYRERRDRRRRTVERAADAAREVRVALGPVVELVKESLDHCVDAAVVASCWRTAARAMEDHRHALPTEWSHLKRSVRGSLGEHFGGPSLADLSYGPETSELSSMSPTWQDHALCYLEYVRDRLSAAAAHPERLSAEIHLWDFDYWLGATGRHGVDRWSARLGWREKQRHKLAATS